MKNGTTKDEFWLGLEDYSDDPAFRKLAENEFLTSPLQTGDGQDGLARREFLKLMGASIALASATGCTRPAQTIIPYAKAPKEVIPGVPNFYASSWFDGTEGFGLVVETREGRPTKVEGNPEHPLNTGRLSARAQAALMMLYDPDRLKGPVRNLVNKTRTNRETINAKWEEADKAVLEQLAKGSVVILNGSNPSPSSQAVIQDFSGSFGARTVTWDSMNLESVREAARLSYGTAKVPRYRFDRAKFVVSIDADFLGGYLSPTEFNRQWAQVRKPGADMVKLVSFESTMTLTGLNADERIRIRPSQQLDVVLGLMAQMPGVKVAKTVENYKDIATRLNVPSEAFAKIAKDLWENRGKSVVIAGGLTTETENSVHLQIAVNMLNSMLGNDGVTIDHAGGYNHHQGSTSALIGLINDMEAGKVQTLIINGVNPVYNSPHRDRFVAASAKVPMVISTANSNDETASIANYVLPSGTSFEAWGDYEFVPGVYSIQQPTIRPLHKTRSFEESLLLWTQGSAKAPARAKGAKDYYEYVRGQWRGVYSKASGGKSFDDFWNATLQNGVVDTVGNRGAGGGPSFSGAVHIDEIKKGVDAPYELALYTKSHIGDGDMANVSFIQELPDPVTKIVWENYLNVSPAAAKREKLREGDVVTLTVGKNKIEVPVHVQPGMHDNVVSLAIGFGRTRAGKVANKLGVDAFKVAVGDDKRAIYSGLAASFKKSGGWVDLACTQGHHQLEGRPHVVETTLTNYMKNPASGKHEHHVFSIWPEHQYNGHKWAMSVDLNACTGCSACVMACNMENNVPVVGKAYILQGREMHWIRIDRYYKGTPDNPQAVFEPMMCQHCENAPCETVCPVLATVHSEEGLNEMVYNRCVGTRYCANNCPYKVRRFNWFNYSKREAPLHMALNPDVTVRSRGVMEKCSFCVQRIRAGTNKAKDEKRKLADGDIKTACQQTCPTDAIVFGDLADPNSQVAKMHKDARAFSVLQELNTVPRVRYLSRVRNTETSMPNILMDDKKELEKHMHHEGGHA